MPTQRSKLVILFISILALCSYTFYIEWWLVSVMISAELLYIGMLIFDIKKQMRLKFTATWMFILGGPVFLVDGINSGILAGWQLGIFTIFFVTTFVFVYKKIGKQNQN